MELWFWVWVVVAVLFSVAEMFTAGFFMLPFGIGAGVAAVLAYFDIALVWQWVVFVGLSTLLMFTLRRFSDTMTHDSPQMVGSDRLIGRPGVVIEAIEPASGAGRIRVDREEWRADTQDDVAIAEGAAVTVVALVGAHLVVKPFSDQQAD